VEIKIANKADMPIKKRNLEGNNIKLKNSFAGLDNSIMVIKFSKMGGNSTKTNLEHFDLLKDLEMARNNLKDRAQILSKETELENTDNLPLED
jgi:hypothetical protein